MAYIISKSIDDCIDALAAFVGPFVPNGELVRAQQNRVSQIPAIGVVFTELMTVDLETPTLKFANGEYTISTPKRLDVQLDFYGELADDQCNAVKTAYRTFWSTDQFPAWIKPMYCSDGVQGPFISGESQYSNRWILTVSLHFNSTLTVPQDSANQISILVSGGNANQNVTGETGLVGIL